MIVYAENQPKNCYVFPMAIDAIDKGPFHVNAFTKTGQFEDVTFKIRLFSVTKSLIVTQNNTLLAIKPKDLNSTAKTIWNLPIPCQDLVNAVEVQDSRLDSLGIQFTNSEGTVTSFKHSPVLILGRKRNALNMTIITCGGSVGGRKVISPRSLTIFPATSCKSSLCVTAPNNAFVSKFVPVTTFTKKSLSDGLNGNYSQFAQYKAVVKNVRTISKLEQLSTLHEKFANQLKIDCKLSDRECDQLKQILDIYGKPISTDRSENSVCKLMLNLIKNRNGTDIDVFAVKMKLGLEPTKRSVSERIATFHADLKAIVQKVKKNEDTNKRDNNSISDESVAAGSDDIVNKRSKLK